MADKTKFVEIRGTRVLFDGKYYGPGPEVEVPSDFPEEGDVDSKPLPERINQKPSSTPPNTGGVNTGENLPRTAEVQVTTISGKSQEDLESMDKARLERLATELNVRVDRHDDDGNVEDGEPLKRDYIRVLSGQA